MSISYNNYLGVYVEIGFSKNGTDLDESLDQEFYQSLINIRYYVECNSPEIIIPNIEWNTRKDLVNCKEETYCQDLTNFDIKLEIENFKKKFEKELNFLNENFNDVNVKFGWINYIC